MKAKKFKKILFPILALAFLVINGMFLFPKQAQAFEEFGDRCYQTWYVAGTPTQKQSFKECDNCTRIEAWNPYDRKRCDPAVE